MRVGAIYCKVANALQNDCILLSLARLSPKDEEAHFPMLREQAQKWLTQLTELNKGPKKLIVFLFDAACSLFATWLAYSVRLESFYVPQPIDLAVAGLAFAFYLPFFIYFGLYSSMIRYSGLRTILISAKAVAAYGAILFITLLILHWEGVPRSVGVLQPLFFFFLISNGRLVASQVLQGVMGANQRRRKVVIFGAGAAGIQLAEQMFRTSEYRLYCFVDRDPQRIGRIINGKKVFPAENLKQIVLENHIKEVMLAIPNAQTELRRQVIAELSDLVVRVRSVPALNELVQGTADVSQLRDLDVNDLIDRVPVSTINITPGIAGKTVLVTGAAGSIGSELCRQLLELKPSKLLLLDHSEIGLYSIEAELQSLNRARSLDVTIHAHLANVRDLTRLEHVFAQYKPQLVYHAAAYKHVPLVEANPAEGITTNVFGTQNLVKLVKEYAAERLVLISTDKAVRPTNVMGATKRLAEQVVQNAAAEVARQARPTVFTMVRFGNVLGSSGSVVPLFRSQIQNGGPVTITHPEVTRYFMTIPEAVNLVLQAGEMARGGEVFLLDMGEPVKIIDLARKMIRLSGLNELNSENPNGQIEIKTIGLRDGEKLIEELLISADAEPTQHPQIMMANEDYTEASVLSADLVLLEKAVAHNDAETITDILSRTVSGFTPYVASEQDISGRKALS